MTNEEKILDILASMSLRMATKEDVAKINVKLESEFEPKLQALAEGHDAILEQMTPRCRMDDMENELRFLKTVVYQLNDEVQALKKAQ